jgi:hypothetical protein
VAVVPPDISYGARCHGNSEEKYQPYFFTDRSYRRSRKTTKL